MSLKISVVAIFYNSAQFIEKCIGSILNQKDVDLELIAVDDCSSDTTLQLLREIAQRDSRVKVITHTHNQGIAAARNSGISAVSGDCFILIDGDDWLADGALKVMSEHYSDDIDWVQGGYDIVNEDGEKIGERKNKTAKFINRESIINNFFQIEFIWTHNRLVNKRFKSIGFPLQRIHEDWFWNIDAYPSLNKIININTTTYYYVSRCKSFSNDSRFSAKYINDGVELVERMMLMDDNWQIMAQSMTISTLIKNLYIGNFDIKFRSHIIKRLLSAKAYPLKIDISGYARFQKILDKIMPYPDWVRMLIVNIYKFYIRLFNKAI